MPPKLTLVTPNSHEALSDPVEAATGRRTSQLRPTSWINYQNEKQRSQELKRAKREEEDRNMSQNVNSETPMIDKTSAFFRRLFRRGDRTG